MKDMEWREFVGADPTILLGKPVIKGTRISVEHILELLGSGWSMPQILDEYPHLSAEQIQAACMYGAELAREEQVFTPGA